MLAFVEPFENGTVTQKKALLHALVAAVRVKGQNSIQPIFRVPMKKVRLMDGLVHPCTHNPNLAGRLLSL